MEGKRRQPWGLPYTFFLVTFHHVMSEGQLNLFCDLCGYWIGWFRCCQQVTVKCIQLTGHTVPDVSWSHTLSISKEYIKIDLDATRKISDMLRMILSGLEGKHASCRFSTAGVGSYATDVAFVAAPLASQFMLFATCRKKWRNRDSSASESHDVPWDQRITIFSKRVRQLWRSGAVPKWSPHFQAWILWR